MRISQRISLSKKFGLTQIAGDLDFRKQNILVTGGADGIGAAIVTALHGLGAHVTVLDIQQDKLDTLKKTLGTRITTFAFDLSQSDPAAYDDLAQKIVTSVPHGKIDAFIMNAGVIKLTDITKHNSVANTPSWEFQTLAQINAHSHADIYRALSSHFSDDARLVVTSSPIVGRADPKTAAYSVSKRMLESYANNIAAEINSSGKQINGYVPPPVQNFLRTDIKPDEPAHAHPDGIDIVEIPLRLAARSVAPQFNGKVISFAYDHLRDKSRTTPSGAAYDFMPRSTVDNGFVYDLRWRGFDQGGGDDGETLVQGYSTAAMRVIMGLGVTPDMDPDTPIRQLYKMPDHIQKHRSTKP